MMINILICDDMEEIRQYFEWIINSCDDMHVVAAASSGEQAVEYADKYSPDIVLMDVQMAESSDGITATERITAAHPHLKVIMLTIHNDDELLIDSYAAGAVDYLNKETDADKILATIRSAYANEYFVGPKIARTVKEKYKRGRSFEMSAVFFINNMSKLTNSEWKILKCIYDGKKRKEIANELVLSDETVKFHTRNILKKLQFPTTAEAVAFLKKMQIIEKFNL